MTTTILLADDQVMMRDGLASIISSRTDYKIVGEASTGREAIQLASELCPDIIVMAHEMHDLNGAEATRRIVHADPKTRIIALSMFRDRPFILAMLDAGAAACVIKTSAAEELLRAIRTVREGKRYLCPQAAAALQSDGNGASRHIAREPLTPREREVLQRVAEGRSSREIAHSLGVSSATIEVHRRHIMRKLNMHTVADLTRYAILEGLTTLP